MSQGNSGVNGIVTTKRGQPIAGVSVSESLSKTCCPFKREQATSDEKGFFRLEQPGAVVHFYKEGFEPQAMVVPDGAMELHPILLDASNDLIAPPCKSHRPGMKQIGGLVRFDIPRRGVKVLGGKTDVDYVRYVIKPRNGSAYLELWFGPYAMGIEPHDEDFVNSVDFSQRQIVAPSLGALGTDSWGTRRDQEKWRQTVVVGEGGSRYRAKRPGDIALFDQIVDSICMTPFESAVSTTPSNSQSKP